MEYSVIITSFLNISLHESLSLLFVIILRLFFYRINTFFVLEEPPQKIIP
jgi:hypothetical protein